MKTKLTKATVLNLISGMSRPEQRALAKRFGLKMGKSGKDTANNIVAAVEAEKIKFTAVVQIKTVPDANSKYGDLVYSRKVRNLTGKEDRVLFPVAEVAPTPAPSPAAADGNGEGDNDDELP
jgi:hypothetical protein